MSDYDLFQALLNSTGEANATLEMQLPSECFIEESEYFQLNPSQNHNQQRPSAQPQINQDGISLVSTPQISNQAQNGPFSFSQSLHGLAHMHNNIFNVLPSQDVNDQIYSFIEESYCSKNSTTLSTLNVKSNRKRNHHYDCLTKNFLPNFRACHLQYLENALGENYVNSFPLIKAIKAKRGINKKDYQELYSIIQFQQTFCQFFSKKVLYHKLMMSRSSLKARKAHMRKLYAFEKAFIAKRFI